jgi:FecR protein
MKTGKLRVWMILLASLAFALELSTIARAQDDQNQGQYQDQSQDQSQNEDQSQDPPGRVARLNYSQGSVSFRPAGEDDWVTAVPNRPLVTGDDLWADDNSRAEVHVGSTAIRLSARTGITFLNLDDRSTQIRVAQGSLILRVRHVDDEDNYEVDTPNIAFTLLQPGAYRIDVSEDGSRTTTTVWHGRGRVTGGGFTYTVIAGQDAVFSGNQDHLDYDLEQVPDRDDFDNWAFARDDREDRADSANYVSREMTGYEDLDESGDWSYVAGYGPCWRPRAVVVGWAPYRYGHWAYVGPWGWTWVEDEAWGFAPFHYGRWAFAGGGWFWVPGPVVVRPVWAPALVAFVGGGPGFHFAAGVGVGWFPLAPGEVYVPGYRVSRAYVNNVNLTNTNVSVTRVTNVYNTVIVNKSTTINNITYANQHVTNGVTVVSHDTFVNARPVGQNMMKVEPREIASVPVSRTIAAEPGKTSVIGAGRPAPVRPPAAIINRPVVAVRTPPAPPHPIEQRQTQAGGHLNEQALVRPVGPARPAPENQAERPQQGGGGFRPFTPPAGGNQPVKTMPQTQPRTYEAQGTPPENRPARQEKYNSQTENRTENQSFRPIEPAAPQPTHPLVRPMPPVQERNAEQEQQQAQKFNQWKQQRPVSSEKQQSKPESRPEKPSKH